MANISEQNLDHLPSHSVHCPACRKELSLRFAKFGHSNYSLIGCDTCPNLLALSDLDPVVMYLDGKSSGREQELQTTIARALAPCPCGGTFRFFDGRRRCPLCKVLLQEAQISEQVSGLDPKMRPVMQKLYSPGHQSWKNLEFLRDEVEAAARKFEAAPSSGKGREPSDLWFAKEISDIHFRKMTPEKLKALAPSNRNLFFFHNRLYHDHGGARGPWWRFWNREILYPEKCGMVFDIDQKELKCSICSETFPARIR